MVTQTKDIVLTTVFNQIADAWFSGKRRVFIEGGTWSSKTFSALQFLKLTLENYKEPLLATVTSESMPHLKRGAIRDFLSIMGDELIDSQWNKTDFIYTFSKSGGKLEFVSADQPAKLRGGRRDILFCNEANNIARDSYREADMRTRLFTICDWNPVSEFWFHDERLQDEQGHVYVHTTYLDTLEVVPESIRQDLESYEDKDPNWWRIYGLGLIGKVEGLVYPNFGQVDELPEGDYFYGLDYGYLQDPTVLVKNVIIGENLYSQEMFYSYDSLTNTQIGMEMTLAGVTNEPIYPDPDEPKSSDEIRLKGFNIKETVKGPGTVATGIKRVNQFYQHWTKDSLNCIKEQRNYRYIKEMRDNERVSKSVNVTHRWSHGMDSLIAGTLITTKRGDVAIEDVTTDDLVLTRDGWKNVLFSGITASEKEIYAVTFSNGKSITGTADHLIWIDGKGFVPLTDLRYGDIVETWKEKRLSTMGLLSIGIQCLKTGLAQLTFTARRILYSERYGSQSEVQFPKDATFTIRMITHLITQLKTLNVCQRRNILSIIGESVSLLRKLVLNVVDNFRMLITGSKTDFALIIANRGGDAELGRTTNNVYVASAGSSFRSTDLNRYDVVPDCVPNVSAVQRDKISIGQDNVAPVHVLNVSEPHKEKQTVYDITTSETPEFYANGILVHNSRRYAVASYRPGVGIYPSSTSERRFARVTRYRR